MPTPIGTDAYGTPVYLPEEFAEPGEVAFDKFAHGMDHSGFEALQNQFGNELALDLMASGYNSYEAQLNRDFEERMSNTAVTRAVQDIRNAGLNPWLALNGGSFGGGASTPAGAVGSYANGSSGYASHYSADKSKEGRIISALLNGAGKLISALGAALIG